MTNWIIKIEEMFEAYFGHVPESLNGEYHSKIKEMQKMMNDIYEEDSIPSAKEDRKNLKNDGSNVANDLRIAFEKYKKEKATI